MSERPSQKAPIVVLVALLLAGCGVKGALEPPPGVTAAAAPPLNETRAPDTPGESVTSTPTQTRSSINVRGELITPARGEARASSEAKANQPKAADGKKGRLKQGTVPVTSAPVKPDEPFILDSLL